MRVSEALRAREFSMEGKKHHPEQIIEKLSDADTMIVADKTVGQVCQALEVSEKTLHRWRNQVGGMKAEEAKRLKELEEENKRLKKLLAEAELDVFVKPRSEPPRKYVLREWHKCEKWRVAAKRASIQFAVNAFRRDAEFILEDCTRRAARNDDRPSAGCCKSPYAPRNAGRHGRHRVEA
jgi:hypothetical protein